jgi:hypothetical protein
MKLQEYRIKKYHESTKVGKHGKETGKVNDEILLNRET